jgi:hypothetical protein
MDSAKRVIGHKIHTSIALEIFLLAAPKCGPALPAASTPTGLASHPVANIANLALYLPHLALPV